MIREYMNDFAKVFEYMEHNKILQQEVTETQSIGIC